MPFAKCIAAGYVLFCVPKENQKGRRCPQGMKAPVRLFKPQTGLRSKYRAFSAARSPLLSRRGRRRVAAPCVCFVPWTALAFCRPLPQQLLPVSATGRGRRLQTRGYTPLVTPKKMGSIQKIQVASLKDFLCSADFKAPQPLLRQLPAGGSGRACKLCSRASNFAAMPRPLPLGEVAVSVTN